MEVEALLAAPPPPNSPRRPEAVAVEVSL